MAKSKSIAMNLDERKLRIRRSVEFSSATKDAYLATKEESGDVDLSQSETGSEEDVTGRPFAYKTATGETLCIK